VGVDFVSDADELRHIQEKEHYDSHPYHQRYSTPKLQPRFPALTFPCVTTGFRILKKESKLIVRRLINREVVSR
jgi:hypothetical protein